MALHEWEPIHQDRFETSTGFTFIGRIEVPGGWLYRFICTSHDTISQNVVFVATPLEDYTEPC